MIKDIPYCQNNFEDYVFRFLSAIDPFNNKKITFNECVSLFSMEMISDNDNIASSVDVIDVALELLGGSVKGFPLNIDADVLIS